MGTFSLELKKFSDKVNARADQATGLIVAKIAQRLDERSPVGDASYWKHKPPKGYVGGRFRGNWQLGVGVVPAGETGRIDPAGSETVAAIVAEIPTEAAGRVFYLANNVPYAIPLEEGHSRQAPNGVVALTAMEFQALAANAVGEQAWQE